jgi:hypothetical protein
MPRQTDARIAQRPAPPSVCARLPQATELVQVKGDADVGIPLEFEALSVQLLSRLPLGACQAPDLTGPSECRSAVFVDVRWDGEKRQGSMAVSCGHPPLLRKPGQVWDLTPTKTPVTSWWGRFGAIPETLTWPPPISSPPSFHLSSASTSSSSSSFDLPR